MKQLLSILAVYAGLVSTSIAAPLTVHEWGTFTSFMGSDGQLIEGMHHEDEPLPSFVHGMRKNENKSFPPPRCIPNSKVECATLMELTRTHSELFPEAPVSSGVTQKMETPVIYFYGNPGDKASVEITFPQGIITQYYPEASFIKPALNEVKELKDSRFVFDVTLLSLKDKLNFPATQEKSIWNPARAVSKANPIRVDNGEKEQFIFYRGVGNFASPLKVSSNEQDVLTLDNSSQSNISMAIVLNSDGNKGSLSVLYNLNKEAKLPIPELKSGLPFGDYIQKTKKTIADALIAGGLYEDEALAMVNTWEKSYFHTPGIRVLYIVPNEDTETILPLSVKPAPVEIKRVLVGRIEVMTKNEEISYLKKLETQTAPFQVESVFGRFTEPKLRRLEQIAPPGLKEKIRAML